jgi:hypothetical protein
MANTRAKKSATAPKNPSGVKPTKAPTTREAADLFSVELTPPLKPEQTARLRKALPGYVGILDDVAALLDEDAAVLNLPGVTPEALLQAQAQQKYLAAREAVAHASMRSSRQSRAMTAGIQERPEHTSVPDVAAVHGRMSAVLPAIPHPSVSTRFSFRPAIKERPDPIRDPVQHDRGYRLLELLVLR